MPEKEKIIDIASLIPDLQLNTEGWKFDRDEENAR